MLELRVVTFCLIPHFLGEEIQVQRDEIYMAQLHELAGLGAKTMNLKLLAYS